MKHPSRSLELFEFNLGKVFDFFCHNVPSGMCGSCEFCQLKDRFVQVRQWFDRASDISQRHFLTGLVRRLKSIDLIRSLVRILHPLNSKDSVYVFSRSFPSLLSDRPTISDDRALDKDKLRQMIEDTWNWFQLGSYWTKVNFLLALFHICKSHLLHTVGQQSFALLQIYEKHKTNDDLRDDLEASTYEPLPCNFSFNNNLENFSFLHEHSNSKEDSLEAILVSNSLLTDTVTALQDIQADNKNAMTFVPDIDDNPPQELSDFKDFIRCLPVHLSKYVLHLLDQTSLSCCMRVSRLWKMLSQEVVHESRFRLTMKKEIVLMQGAAAEGCNPCYANDVTVAVPNVGCGWQVMEGESRSTCPEEKDPIFAQAYAGYSSRKIIMEERNVYCGPYNVMKMADRSDPSRVVHMDSGKLIAIGGSDKRVHLINTESCQQIVPVISGHAGSVKCVLIKEKEGFVISGSFDTSIRKWSLLTSKCLKIYRGHTETVTCVNLSVGFLASGSVDNTCKVWECETGKCLQTFKHKTPVTSVAISEDLCISGSSDSQIKVWHLSTGTLIKRLTDHKGAITAIVFDRWHIITSAMDSYAFVWSSQGNFSKCLTALHHPNNVLCLVFKYLRVITGCADGKIRVWNLATGLCLRVLRGNSNGDPIMQLVTANNRILVNTKSCVLMMTFECLEYDYTLPDDKMPSMIQNPSSNLSRVQFQPRSFIRAQQMVLSGATNTKIIHHDEKSTLSTKSKGLHRVSTRALSAGSGAVTLAELKSRCATPNISSTSQSILEGADLRETAKDTAGESASVADVTDEDRRKARRISWAFEHPVITVPRPMSLTETRSLLRSQIRAKGKTKPPDFVAQTVNVIRASLKPTQDDDKLEMNQTKQELIQMKLLKRPLSSPSRVDPRLKVLVTQLELDKIRMIPVMENSSLTGCKESAAMTTRQADTNVKKSSETRDETLRSAERSRSSLHTTRFAAPKVNLIRPHTSATVGASDLGDTTTCLRPRSSMSDSGWRQRKSIRHNVTTSSQGIAVVPMLMYSKEVTSHFEDPKEQRFTSSSPKLQVSWMLNGDGSKSKPFNDVVSPYSDPMRSKFNLKLLTHQQLTEEMQKVKLRQEESESFKKLEEEQRKKAAWLQGIKNVTF